MVESGSCVSIGFADFVDRKNPPAGLINFVDALVNAHVDVLADLRVEPVCRGTGSAIAPFDRPNLEAALGKHKISYEFYGDSLGGVPGPQDANPEFPGIFYNIQQPQGHGALDHLDKLVRSGKRVAVMCYCATHSWTACHRCVVLTHLRKLRPPPISVDVLVRQQEEPDVCTIASFPDSLEYDDKLLKQQNRNVFLEGCPPFVQFIGPQTTLPASNSTSSTTNENVEMDVGKCMYTIGHSKHSLQEFLDLLKKYGIKHLIDVRASAKSYKFKHFSDTSLQQHLGKENIKYTHRPQLGGIPGGMNKNESENGTDLPSNIAKQFDTSSLPKGIFWNLRQPNGIKMLDEIVSTSKEERCAIMCGCGSWRFCHRQVISTNVSQKGVPVRHISVTGTLEKHPETMLYDKELVQSQGGFGDDYGTIYTSPAENVTGYAQHDVSSKPKKKASRWGKKKS